jgi:hypothetical protein
VVAPATGMRHATNDHARERVARKADAARHPRGGRGHPPRLQPAPSAHVPQRAFHHAGGRTLVVAVRRRSRRRAGALRVLGGPVGPAARRAAERRPDGDPPARTGDPVIKWLARSDLIRQRLPLRPDIEGAVDRIFAAIEIAASGSRRSATILPPAGRRSRSNMRGGVPALRRSGQSAGRAILVTRRLSIWSRANRVETLRPRALRMDGQGHRGDADNVSQRAARRALRPFRVGDGQLARDQQASFVRDRPRSCAGSCAPSACTGT